jgi:hypothetical protein
MRNVDNSDINKTQRRTAKRYPSYAYPNETEPPHRAALQARVEQLTEGKVEGEKEQRRERAAAWKAVAPASTEFEEERVHWYLDGVLKRMT